MPILTNKDFYKTFQRAATILVLTAATFAVTMMYINPLFVDYLAYEDGLIENISAVFLALAAFILFIQAFRFITKRHWALTTGLLLMGLLFSFICMEEISWGQRILDIESPEFFLENNVQDETNLHNLHTDLSEMIYYTGAFILLVALPIFRESVTTLLRRVKLSRLTIFQPASWLIIPFAITSGFSGSGRLVFGYVLATFAATLVLLGMTLSRQQSTKASSLKIFTTILTTILICLALYVSNYTYLISSEMRGWSLTEWKELFIAFGILCYVVSLCVSESSSQREDV